MTQCKAPNTSTTKNVLSQANNPELFSYYHAALFRPTNTSLLKAIKKIFLKSWPGLSESLLKKHVGKFINTKMENPQIKIQRVQSTIKKAPDTYLRDNIKTSLVFCVKLDPSDTNEGKIYLDLCGRFPIMSNKENRCIYVMYVYDCNATLTSPMKNISDKEIIHSFTDLATDLKSRGFNP